MDISIVEMGKNKFQLVVSWVCLRFFFPNGTSTTWGFYGENCFLKTLKQFPSIKLDIEWGGVSSMMIQHFFMWVKQCHKPPMTVNGWNPTYLWWWLGDGLLVYYWLFHKKVGIQCMYSSKKDLVFWETTVYPSYTNFFWEDDHQRQNGRVPNFRQSHSYMLNHPCLYQMVDAPAISKTLCKQFYTISLMGISGS